MLSGSAARSAEALSAAPLAAPNRGLARAAAIVLTVGSLLFLSGGRAHPSINVALGAGPEDFFRAFADTLLNTHGWHAMHMLILVGPLSWAVAAPVLLDAIEPSVRTLTSAARSMLVLSGALWAVAFVLDGFGAPVYAGAIAGAGSSAIEAAVRTSFEANAIMMSRLGLVSWVAGGLGMAVLGGSLLAHAGRMWWRIAVGVTGIAIGGWPLLAALEGEYAGGPFTSQYWMQNALAVGAWYIALATCALLPRPAPGGVSREARSAHRDVNSDGERAV